MSTLPERLKELASRMNQDGDKYDAFTLLAEAVQALQAAPEGGEWVLVPRHYNVNVAYAACVLEQSTCAIDRLNAPPLRTLEKALSAAPSPTAALQAGEAK